MIEISRNISVGHVVATWLNKVSRQLDSTVILNATSRALDKAFLKTSSKINVSEALKNPLWSEIKENCT